MADTTKLGQLSFGSDHSPQLHCLFRLLVFVAIRLNFAKESQFRANFVAGFNDVSNEKKTTKHSSSPHSCQLSSRTATWQQHSQRQSTTTDYFLSRFRCPRRPADSALHRG